MITFAYSTKNRVSILRDGEEIGFLYLDSPEPHFEMADNVIPDEFFLTVEEMRFCIEYYDEYVCQKV